MGFLDKAKAAAEQAAAKAKEGIEDAQTKVELGRAYNELGKATFELIDKGELSEARLDAPAAKIRALLEKAPAGGAATDTGGESSEESYDSSLPPAMPT